MQLDARRVGVELRHAVDVARDAGVARARADAAKARVAQLARRELVEVRVRRVAGGVAHAAHRRRPRACRCGTAVTLTGSVCGSSGSFCAVTVTGGSVKRMTGCASGWAYASADASRQRGQTGGTREPSEWQHAQNSPIGTCILVSRVDAVTTKLFALRASMRPGRDWAMKLLTIVSVLGFTVAAAAQPPQTCPARAPQARLRTGRSGRGPIAPACRRKPACSSSGRRRAAARVVDFGPGRRLRIARDQGRSHLRPGAARGRAQQHRREPEPRRRQGRLDEGRSGAAATTIAGRGRAARRRSTAIGSTS